ncbi:MAG: hypothetical protein IT426_05470 [Pirellulales bacterium]|nr:hypothetical protein [Pirellulales bacterium]
MITNPAYEEIIDFVAAGTNPQGIIDFHPSPTAKAKITDLIAREKTTGLSVEERSELDNFLQLEHFMRLAKAKAREHVIHG